MRLTPQVAIAVEMSMFASAVKIAVIASCKGILITFEASRELGQATSTALWGAVK